MESDSIVGTGRPLRNDMGHIACMRPGCTAWMPLDLRQIQQARLLAEHGSFVRAAEALGIA